MERSPMEASPAEGRFAVCSPAGGRFGQGSRAEGSVAEGRVTDGNTLMTVPLSESITEFSAQELAGRMWAGRLTCEQVMAAFLARIAGVNPQINAVVSQIDDQQALALAAAADARRAAGGPLGALFGLPMAVKDLLDVKGLPTTQGSPLFADHIAARDCLLVARLKAAGALIIGKTNVPELGLGSHTFNPLFGPTRNPHDPSRSAGGSSGGAAAALAAGMLPLADGSDLGGSLRNPASFCGVVGFRPSIGRVPASRGDRGWLARLATEGPLARTVADAALLLGVLAGPDSHDPLALPSDPDIGTGQVQPLSPAARPRLAWTADCDAWPVDPEIVSVCHRSLDALRAVGCTVTADHPDVTGAMDIFQRQRAATLRSGARQFERHIPDWRARSRDVVVWNLERGLALTATDILASEIERMALFRRFAKFFERYDFLVLPTVQVAPFPVEIGYPTEINGQPMATYLDWMASCCVLSLPGLPAVSVPCGRTAAGLPVGLQIVGPPRADAALLTIAGAFEAALAFDRRIPETADKPPNGQE